MVSFCANNSHFCGRRGAPPADSWPLVWPIHFCAPTTGHQTYCEILMSVHVVQLCGLAGLRVGKHILGFRSPNGIDWDGKPARPCPASSSTGNQPTMLRSSSSSSIIGHHHHQPGDKMSSCSRWFFCGAVRGRQPTGFFRAAG